MTALSTDRARALIERFDAVTVLVLGDVMIDHFLVGRVDRISPEAPVPIVRFDHDDYRIGGAANVANNVGALGGRATLVGVVGQDETSERLMTALRTASIDSAGIAAVASRPTTRKLRIVTARNQQVARVDFESDRELDEGERQALRPRLAAAARAADVIVVSDYLKGVVTREIMSDTLAIGRDRQIPVLVDPKIPHLEYYAGCSLLTPNDHEAAVATHRTTRTDDETRIAAAALRSRVGCESVLITRGERGMWLLDGSNRQAAPEEAILPAVAREVSDVTGAGDTVIATMALGLAAGATLAESAMLANQAAGLAVARFGPATVSAQELLDACADK